MEIANVGFVASGCLCIGFLLGCFWHSIQFGDGE